jgi:uncharacterized protein YktB (UPF0637 family)
MNVKDGGYYDGKNWSDTPKGLNSLEQRQMAVARSRHERVNARFETWSALGQKYRHKKESHWAMLLTQLPTSPS